jgi:hypothetical protein
MRQISTDVAGPRGGTGFADALAGALLAEAPRVIGVVDRDPDSPTAGCMDRTFWAWKFTDFAGSRFQEGVCYLAFLCTRRLEDNPYVNNPALLQWIGMALDRWSRLQHRDGSFDEAYPFERSLAATSFSSFYIAEALDMLGEAIEPHTLERTRLALARAGEWLLRNDETHGFLSNHLAAAAAALQHIHRVTGEARFDRRSAHFRDRILDRQSAEGWYDEYGGADPGYQTHGTFYLVRLWQLTGDERLAESIERSIEFLAHFIHPDGSVGGEYASRNTQTYYPAAFEMMAHRNPAASWISRTMRPSVLGGAAAGLRAVDSYNWFPVLNNLVFAYRAAASGEPVARPIEPDAGATALWYPDAGIARIRRDRYDAYVGATKGGVIKVWDRGTGRLVLSDCGWVGRTFDGSVASTQYHDGDRAVSVEGDRIEVGGCLSRSARPVMSPARFIAFRTFSTTIGRLAGVGRWLKQQLVRVLIYRRQQLPVTFNRTITFEDNRIVVADRLHGDHEGRLESLRRGAVFTTIHMGSSRYFVLNELNAEPGIVVQSDATWNIDPAALGVGVEVERALELD